MKFDTFCLRKKEIKLRKESAVVGSLLGTPAAVAKLYSKVQHLQTQNPELYLSEGAAPWMFGVFENHSRLP